MKEFTRIFGNFLEIILPILWPGNSARGSWGKLNTGAENKSQFGPPFFYWNRWSQMNFIVWLPILLVESASLQVEIISRTDLQDFSKNSRLQRSDKSSQATSCSRNHHRGIKTFKSKQIFHADFGLSRWPAFDLEPGRLTWNDLEP